MTKEKEQNTNVATNPSRYPLVRESFDTDSVENNNIISEGDEE